MRDIKFRAWVKRAQQMASWEEIQEKQNLHRLIGNDEYPLMQFTGYKDKDGVEIYEGDIVYVAGMGDCKVEWDEAHAGWIFENWDYGEEFSTCIEDIETIVGNIYENPELAKAM